MNSKSKPENSKKRPTTPGLSNEQEIASWNESLSPSKEIEYMKKHSRRSAMKDLKESTTSGPSTVNVMDEEGFHFTRVYRDVAGKVTNRVLVSTIDPDLEVVIDEFRGFLHACGYSQAKIDHFIGEIE